MTDKVKDAKTEDVTPELAQNGEVEERQEEAEASEEAVVEELQKEPDVQNLLNSFHSLLKNVDFLIDEAWISRAINGLDKPNLDERMEAQLRTNVLKELRNQAGKIAEEGGEYVPVTPEAVEAEVQRRLAKRKEEVEQKKKRRLNNARNRAREALNKAS